jgi:hypothetical protein
MKSQKRRVDLELGLRNYTLNMSEPLQVRVSREGKEVGVYSAGEAVRLLRDGVLLRTDHYWHKGMKAWCLLPELVADPEIPPPMPISESLPSEQTFFVRLGWVVSAPFVLALFGIPLACGFIHGIDFYKERQPSLFSLADSVGAFFRHAIDGLVSAGKFEFFVLCAFGVFLGLIWLFSGERGIKRLYGDDFFEKNHSWIFEPMLQCYFWSFLFFGPGFLFLKAIGLINYS